METVRAVSTKITILLEGKKVEIPFQEKLVAKDFESCEAKIGFTNALAHFWHYHSLVLPEETLRKIPAKRLFDIAKKVPNKSRVITQMWRYFVNRLQVGENFSVQKRVILGFVIEKSHYQEDLKDLQRYKDLIAKYS